MSNQTVIFEELEATEGGFIGVARLNAPRSMNAISLEMIRLLKSRLDDWAKDEKIRAVWLEGEGDKALCAGGDIVALYRDMTEPRSDSHQAGVGKHFFTEEYDLDYLIHTFPKPFIVWGNGVVMGGGVGLMAGGSHRVVTEHSKIAMPETSIGLYPDVGAGWFLNRMPGRTGLFLGLTGARLNGADALFLGLADRFIRHDLKASVLETLQQADLLTTSAANISEVLRRFAEESSNDLPQSVVRSHYDEIQSLTDAHSLEEVVGNIAGYDGEDPWLKRAAKTIATASPTALAIHWQHYHQSQHASLSEVFNKELTLSLNCLEKGEFAEGVRALLIDKDLQPRWQYPTLASLDSAWVNGFFERS
ncbi:enoyl-CoA hydratase/isomerase family protein [Marinobacter salicampi]|uniref:enoyl-CoA hydratase/isomerase family protein n=1 Tax=Marinobacter salicampi TaxID=435907 RepID=UPI001408DB3A|nr:enoyl-CoA hydratase/isomerase family protein [Marinobacter salicampi]